MKFDLHCHIKGGSIDSRVSMDRYIEILRQQGFGGMLVTDHDSYKAFDAYQKKRESATPPSSRKDDGDFVVLCGIEYDTRDAGHFLVIMPDEVRLSLLTIRGMSIEELIQVVHRFGGILGPAHPYGAKSSSSMFTFKMRRKPQLIFLFDFVEGFNTCELPIRNRMAVRLADRHHLPCIGGSDAHCEKHVGTAYTDFSAPIRSNNDLIRCIKERKIRSFGGTERIPRFRNRFRYIFPATLAFKAFNRSVSLLFARKRNMHLQNAMYEHL